MKRTALIVAVTLMSVLQVCAQNQKVADKELIGVWMMESLQYDGEKKTMCGKASGYTQFKYYGADGEYACAEICPMSMAPIRSRMGCIARWADQQ